MGSIVNITAKVVQASNTGGAAMIIINQELVNNSTMALIGLLSFTLDLTHAGTRVLTQSALTGFLGTDALTLASVSQSTLPANSLVGGSYQWKFSYNQNAYQTMSFLWSS